MPAVVPPLSSGPRGPGEGLCLQDPGLLALGSGLAHHLRCSRLGSGAPGITGWPSGERVRILGCSPSLNGVGGGKQAQTLVCFPGPSCAGGTFPLAVLGGGCGFGLASPSSCLRLPIFAVVSLTLPPTHLPAVRARDPRVCPSLLPEPYSLASPSSPHLALGGGAL